MGGDGLVPTGIPPEETLVDPGRGSTVVGSDARHGQASEEEGARYHDPAESPRREGDDNGATEGPLPGAHQNGQGLVGAYCTSPMGW